MDDSIRNKMREVDDYCGKQERGCTKCLINKDSKARDMCDTKYFLGDGWTDEEADYLLSVIYPKSENILDSGERTEFSTGAVRDMHEGKGDMVSIPWEAILRLSRHYEAGAKKYNRFNFRKGILLSSYIDSACRHLAKYQCGCDDEDHLAAAAFNILGAMLVEEKTPELIDLPLREGKNRFCYFEVGSGLPNDPV